MYTDVLLALSNLFFLFPFVRATLKHRWTRAMIYLFLVFISGFYHACYSEMNLCFVAHSIHQRLDFFFSYLLIPLTGLYFIDFTGGFAFLERWIIMLTALMLFLLIVDPTVDQTTLQYWLLSVSTSLILLGIVLNWRVYQPDAVAIGLLATLIAFAFFVLSESNHSKYWIYHGLWHMFAALGQFFILDMRKAASPYAAMDASISLV